MADFKLLITGEQADAAADELEATLAGDGAAGRPTVAVTRSRAETLPEADRKVAAELIALAALVISIPEGILKAMDLADRIRKRRRAAALIETATRVRVEKRVETY